MPQPCIIFLHIPKSGGVTLMRVLRWRYRPLFRVQTMRTPLTNVGMRPLVERERARLITGHMHYGVHRYIPQECVYITMLREPVARVLSTYRFILSKRTHSRHEEVVRSGIELEEFVEAWVDPSVDNLQTRLLSGRGDEWIPREKPRELSRDDLDEAKGNLADCLVVGLTERFDESFLLIRRALGWKLPFYISGNISPHVSFPVTERAIDLIRERNQFDIELYDFAQERFSVAVERQGPSLQRELAFFRAWNRVPNKIFPHVEGLVRRAWSSRFPSEAAR